MTDLSAHKVHSHISATINFSYLLILFSCKYIVYHLDSAVPLEHVDEPRLQTWNNV